MDRGEARQEVMKTQPGIRDAPRVSELSACDHDQHALAYQISARARFLNSDDHGSDTILFLSLRLVPLRRRQIWRNR